MAIVDSLLKLVTMRGADSLVVRSGEVPFLTKGGEKLALSMPTPGADVVSAILEQVTAADELARLENDGRLSAHYHCDGSDFAIEILGLDEGYCMTFQLGTGLPPPPEANHKPRRRTPDQPYRSSGSIQQLLNHTEELDASDVIFSSSEAPRARVGGDLRRLEHRPLGEEDVLALVDPAMSDADRATFEADGSCDFAFTTERGSRYRVNLFKQERGFAAAFRPIRTEVPTLESLNLPSDFRELTMHRSGLVLMVGTAGSGKSTTLVALIEQLNRTVDKHIITLEDPIEYTYAPNRCLIHQREVGRHVSDFSTGLRAALRESPDIVLVGEMRDRDTISAVLTAAETGHLVLSTLHSGNSAMAIDRIVDVYPEHQQSQVRYQLADVLRAVVTQVLLPSTQPPLRVAAYERLEVTSAVSTKIRENRCHQIETELQKGRAEGMVPLELSLARLVKRNLLSRQTALTIAADTLLLEQLIRS